MAQSNSSRLGFLALITTLCFARGVISDSLTFESLNPAINLAYIKKNCWNLEDPMIIFLGTHKARARGSEGSSSSALASTPPTPSLAPGPSAPPSSVPAQVFTTRLSIGLSLAWRISWHRWPGQESSLLLWGGGGGEAFAAQEPQPEPQPEVVPEATPEATPQASPVASPVLEVSEEEDGTSTWDPWPVTAQDIPQPAQDAPSSPLDKPTMKQDEP
ncbi:hypothetical protein GmHk_20G056902 [Glycine max]|nr:hypothetical protein GmHk_20G056902 [Glycine max]